MVNEKKPNVVRDKSFSFALRIVKMNKLLASIIITSKERRDEKK